MKACYRILQIEREIKKREFLAKQAHNNGFDITYISYLNDIMDLKRKLNQLRIQSYLDK